MLKDGTLTYVSLFSSAGIGCHGFKLEGFECVATNEFLPRRLAIQKSNGKCRFETGYVAGDARSEETKDAIRAEVERWKGLGNDGIDVLVATPPCQGMSVANHKKRPDEIVRNSLVVESARLTKELAPKVFVFENVAAFMKTCCVASDGSVKSIGDMIEDELGKGYVIRARVLNFKNRGSASSRTRTLVIGVSRKYEDEISPLELFPKFQKERTLRETIGDLPSLDWGEISDSDFLHAFRTYPPEMRKWIENLKEGESAFDSDDPERRPHRIVDGTYVPNARKNGGKYVRQRWDAVAPCVHTRNDQLASQNTIHPERDGVFSIRELMRMMTIPDDFRWTDASFEELNSASFEEKRRFYKENEANVRKVIGEAVPTEIFRRIAEAVRKRLPEAVSRPNPKRFVEANDLKSSERILAYVSENPDGLTPSLLSRIAETANSKRTENSAYYTNKSLLNEVYDQLPEATTSTIRILEPSVGTGNFLPFLFRKYEAVERVLLDVVDVDGTSLEIARILAEAEGIPKNFEMRRIEGDFLTTEEIADDYFLTVGNPPFGKTSKANRPAGLGSSSNLSALFFERAMEISENVVMILPKNFLNSSDFEETRRKTSERRIDSIVDFGEKGFRGVLIETISVAVGNRAVGRRNSRNEVRIVHVPSGETSRIGQERLASDEYPYWLPYRGDEFDAVAKTLEFGVFDVFRDRQITNSVMHPDERPGDVRVLRSRNLNDDGTISEISGYDGYVSPDDLVGKTVAKFLNDDEAYLVPNMTYRPRMVRMPRNSVANGSVAIMKTKDGRKVSEDDMRYFSSDEFRKFYEVARNRQTRSLNVDAPASFFFGLKRKAFRS